MVAVTAIILLWGVYLVYMSVKMKATGEIPKQMISNKIKLERAKDIPGFIDFMYLRSIIFGVIICVFSAILIVAEYVEINRWLLIFVQLGYLAGIIYYAIITVKAQNKFLF